MSAHTRTLLSHLHRLAAPAASDAVLLSRWIEQRDQAAFAALTARHGPMVLGICRRLLGEEQEAEDVFQAVFLILSRRAARLHKPEALAGFLHTVAVRLAGKARRTRRRQRMQTAAETPEPIDPRPHPLDVLSGRELLALLDEEIARLPEVYRLPLLLCLLQGRTIEEAARLLGWSIGSLRGRLTRGRERLRQRLTRRGLDLSMGAVALLAPVVLPEKLLAAALRHLSEPVPATISALAGGMMPAVKLKIIGLVLVLATAVGLGAGLSLRYTPEPEKSAAPAPPASPARIRDEPRRDRYGDPLPPGAVARLGTLRFRTPGQIVALAFAPDGKTIAVSAHGGLFLFDPASGKRIKRFPSATDDSVKGDWGAEALIVFSPDGKRLISRGHKAVGHSLMPVVRVWELAGDRKPKEYDIGPWVLWVGWSVKGQALAVRVEDSGTLHFHELSAGRSRRFACDKPYKYPSGVISRDPPVACSPYGHILAVPDAENVIHVWDITNGRESCTIPCKGDSIYTLTFSPDGKRLAIHTSAGAQVWDTAKGKVVYTVDVREHYGPPVFTPDGKMLAIRDSSGRIRFCDAATGKERAHTTDSVAFSPAFALSPDGKLLVTATQSGGAFHVWDVATGKRKAEPVGHHSRPHGIVFLPDGRRLATGGGLDGTIQFWDRTTGEPLIRIHRPGQWVRDIALSLDGRSLFSTWTDENLWISDAAAGERRHAIKLEDPDRPDTVQSAISMRLADDGKRLAAVSYYYPKKNGAGPRYQDTLITGWDVSTRKQLFRRRRPGMESWLALSADARMLAVPHSQGFRNPEHPPGKGPMRLEDLATGELLRTFPVLQGQTWPLGFSPDGRLLAANNVYRREAGKDGKPGKQIYTVRLWEILTAAEVLSLPAADFNRVAFARDNRLLALAAPDREIVIWDLALGRERRRFKGFDAEVVWLSFSPDGRELVSSFADSTLLIWDVSAPVPPRNLDAEDAAKAWADLAGKDARCAFRARGILASAPEEAMKLLSKHLHPARPADPQRLHRLLTELESEQFTVREKAQEELQKLGDLAEPALRQTLEGKPTLEVRRRVQALLERLRGLVAQPEVLQALRAVAVLEGIGTPEARRLLEQLAKGAAEARLTREAKASLSRLDLRKPFPSRDR